MRYIDTSAFVKYYGKVGVEKGSDKIIELIENAKKGNAVLISSILFIGETVSVFDKWSRIKALTEEESSKLISDFLNDIIEFIRRDKLVICSGNYKMKNLTMDLIKNYLSKSKLFIEKINNILKNV